MSRLLQRESSKNLTADTRPISHGRPSLDFSGCCSTSCTAGMIPLEVSSLISACLFSSLDAQSDMDGIKRQPYQSVIYGVLNTRRGRPVNIIVLILSSNPAFSTRSLWYFVAPASFAATKRVPTPTQTRQIRV